MGGRRAVGAWAVGIAWALVVTRLLDYLFFDVAFRLRRKAAAPALLRQLVGLLIFGICVAALFKLILPGVNLGAVFTTSAIITAVIGLALQDTLGNLFAGLAASEYVADLKRGDFIFRYVDRDDFGEPEHAFVVCTFWYIDALCALADARIAGVSPSSLVLRRLGSRKIKTTRVPIVFDPVMVATSGAASFQLNCGHQRTISDALRRLPPVSAIRCATAECCRNPMARSFNSPRACRSASR